MMQTLLNWLRGRTARERLLLTTALIVVFVVCLPFLAWRAASQYRTSGEREREAAMALQADTRKLAALQSSPDAAPAVESDGTARGVAMAAASQLGLKISGIEPDGPTGVQTTFEPASAIAVYKWIDILERQGLVVTGVLMVRAGEGDVVAAQARASPRPQ